MNANERWIGSYEIGGSGSQESRGPGEGASRGGVVGGRFVDVDLSSIGSSLSPSLGGAHQGGPPAYEVKFLVDRELGARLKEHFRGWMLVDPNANSQGGGYSIETTYCDTSDLATYRREGVYRRSKLRIRRYEGKGKLFLEEKTKRRGEVSKRRDNVKAEELSYLAGGVCPEGWEGDWYLRKLLELQMAPVCRVRYEREAFYGSDREGPLRVTIDERIRGSAVDGWSGDPAEEVMDLSGDLAVLEFKFRGAMPGMFKKTVEEFGMMVGKFSKFRKCIEACLPGLVRGMVVAAEGDDE